MSSEIPQIPQPVPFQFHGRTDYTTVYKAVDFPLDHFAIFKQNPVNRDRITEANKMLYSLQKQINELREAFIAMAVELDNNVEKKVSITIEMGNSSQKVEGGLLKDTYTFTVPSVDFGTESEVKITAKIVPEEGEEGETIYLTTDEELKCAQDASIEIKAKASESTEPVQITIKKSDEPIIITVTEGQAITFTPEDGQDGKKLVFKPADAETYYTALTIKAGEGEAEEITSDTLEVTVGVVYTFTVSETASETPKEYTISLQTQP